MQLHRYAIAIVVTALSANAQGSMKVTGTATYREHMALPSNAVFEATLQDVSRADAPATVIGTARLDKPGQPPFRFSISYDPAQIDQRHTYAVRAQVTVEGKLMFTSTQSYAVITQGKGATVDMVLKRVGAQPAASPKEAGTTSKVIGANSPLRETYWKLIQVGGKPVAVDEQQREPNIILSAGDRVSGFGGCNSYSGNFALDGSKLTFSGAATTLRACAKGMDVETALHQALSQTRRFKISGDHLELYDSGSKLVARFQAGVQR